MLQITSILCPVDFSDFSVNAYEYARSLAWHYKATLLLQHILYPLGPFGYDSNQDPYEKICRQIRSDATEKMQRFARLHALTGIQAECIVQDGLVTDLILSLLSVSSRCPRGHDRLA